MFFGHEYITVVRTVGARRAVSSLSDALTWKVRRKWKEVTNGDSARTDTELVVVEEDQLHGGTLPPSYTRSDLGSPSTLHLSRHPATAITIFGRICQFEDCRSEQPKETPSPGNTFVRQPCHSLAIHLPRPDRRRPSLRSSTNLPPNQPAQASSVTTPMPPRPTTRHGTFLAPRRTMDARTLSRRCYPRVKSPRHTLTLLTL